MKVKSIKKIAIILVMLILFNVMTPFTTVVHADAGNSFIEKAGGVLLSAIKDLAVFLADCVLELMQNTMFSPQSITITTDEVEDAPSWQSIATIVIGAIVVIVAVVASVVASVLSAGGASPLIIAALSFATKIVGLVGASVAIYGGLSARDELAASKFDIPFIRYTPFEIFSGQVPLLDVNFINPMDDVKITYTEENEKGEKGIYNWEVMYYASYPEAGKFVIHEANLFDSSFGFYPDGEGYEIDESVSNHKKIFDAIDYAEGDVDVWTRLWSREQIKKTATKGMYYKDTKLTEDQLEKSFANPTWKFLEWFSAKLDWNGDLSGFSYKMIHYCEEHDTFNLAGCPKNGDHEYADAGGIVAEIDGVKYVVILVDDHTENSIVFSTALTKETNSEAYIGARKYKFEGDDAILILKGGFIPGEEGIAANYKASSGILQKSVSTWYKVLRRIALVALLSVLLYIGIRIMLCSTAQDKAKYKKMIVDWVAAICILYILHFLIAGVLAITSELSLIFGDKQQETIYVEMPNVTVNGLPLGNDGVWVGSFMGYARLVAGFHSSTTSMSYAVIYVIMVVYTIMFTFIYLKRVIYMAFLTMIAPLIALTYPIDKIKDGNAQAFSLWIREFIFNALLQPVHLILYVILIGNCMDLAVDYPLYAILALGFMVPAEKFLRKMFGFEKAGTVSQLGAAAGGALVGNALGKMGSLGRGLGNLGRGGRGHQGSAGAGAGGEDGSNEGGGNIRTVNNPVAGGNNADSGASGGDGSSGDSENSGAGGGSSNSTTRTTENSGNAETSNSTAATPVANGTQRQNAETSNSTAATPVANGTQRQNTQTGSAQGNNKPAGTLKNSAKTSKGRKVLKGLGYAGKGLAQAGRYGVKVAGLAGRVVLGGTGAMIGAAAGIASGEGIGGALKYGAAGAAGGSALASGATNLATGAIDGVEGLATRGANAVKGASAKSKESKDAYNGIKDSKARDLARDMNLSPEVAGLAHRIATSISGDALYDDNALNKMIASSGADSATQKQMLEYIKRFR